jgi:aminopeptidase
MELLLKRYAQLIIDVQLKLTEGDSLSINTEAITMHFARLLARQACLTTRQSVTIVETNHGKVVQAYPIEPEEKEIFRPPVHTSVMCHLFDLDTIPYRTDTDFASVVGEVTAIAKFGHLSDPVFLDRRIAVPWANVPYPGLTWAAGLLGRTATEEEMWNLFSMLYRLDSGWNVSFWEEQGNVLEYRKKALNKLGTMAGSPSYPMVGSLRPSLPVIRFGPVGERHWPVNDISSLHIRSKPPCCIGLHISQRDHCIIPGLSMCWEPR